MNEWLFDALRCPYCFGAFRVEHSHSTTEEGEYAILECYCEQYPVVAGIPVIRKGVIGARGETVRTITQLIRSRQHQAALLALLMPPLPSGAELLPPWVNALLNGSRVGRVKSVIGKLARPHWFKAVETFLSAGPEGRAGQDYLRVCLGTMKLKKDHDVMLSRFGQPRHLVSLSLMTLIEDPQGPVLDFGCGFGHLTYNLTRRLGKQPLVGADLTFARVYIAKQFLAPEAFYVCCDGSIPLPFLGGLFSTVYSSDTLFLVPNKLTCCRELQRVVDATGLIIISGIRNAIVDPEKYSNCKTMPYYAYENLFKALPHRILTNTDILTRYLEKQGPPLAHSSAPEALEKEPWVSLVVTREESQFVDRGPFADWPHAEGVLTLNSLYQPVAGRINDQGEQFYRHTFPSSWYEHEDGDCRKYEPAEVWISSQMLQDLAAGRRTPEMESLIAHCVIVGVPEGYHSREPIYPRHTPCAA